MPNKNEISSFVENPDLKREINSYNLEVESSPEGLGKSIEYYQQLLKKEGWDPESLLPNGFDEQVQNAMLYGNKALVIVDGARQWDEKEKNKKVKINFEFSRKDGKPANIKITIKDEGDGFNYQQLLDKRGIEVDDNTKVDFGGDSGRGFTYTDFMYDVDFADGGRASILIHPKA